MHYTENWTNQLWISGFRLYLVVIRGLKLIFVCFLQIFTSCIYSIVIVGCVSSVWAHNWHLYFHVIVLSLLIFCSCYKWMFFSLLYIFNFVFLFACLISGSVWRHCRHISTQRSPARVQDPGEYHRGQRVPVWRHQWQGLLPRHRRREILREELGGYGNRGRDWWSRLRIHDRWKGHHLGSHRQKLCRGHVRRVRLCIQQVGLGRFTFI